MRHFKENYKNILYFFYRISSQIIDPIHIIKGLYGYIWYIRDYISYSIKIKKLISIRNLYPQLQDKTKLTPFDAHYYYQQLWVFEEVLKRKPKKHIDIASTYELSGYISKIVPTIFLDYRPIKTNLSNLEIIDGDILNLKFPDNSFDSISCLHVIEHIGLGRYGDPIDPDGLFKACKELERILKPGGILYLSTPIGKERLCFNAHRISNPGFIKNTFSNLKLLNFNFVNDQGEFIEKTEIKNAKDEYYACGMYTLTKPKK